MSGYKNVLPFPAFVFQARWLFLYRRSNITPEKNQSFFVRGDWRTGSLSLRGRVVGFAARFAVDTCRFALLCVSDNANWSR